MLTGASGVPRIRDREDEGQEVRRRCEQERLNAGKAECLNDGWEEVGEAHGYDGACLDEDKKWLEVTFRVSKAYWLMEFETRHAMIS